MKFMTMDEVAETLSVSRITIHRLINKGEIQSLKVGRAVRIPEESLKEYVDRNLKGDNGEQVKKRRHSLMGIVKDGEPITKEDIDEVINEWNRIGSQ